MELFQELNQKFQTLDRFRDIPNMAGMVSNRISAMTGKMWRAGVGGGGGQWGGDAFDGNNALS